MLRTKIFAFVAASWLALGSASAADVTLVNLDGTGAVYDLSLVGRFELTDGGTAYRLVAREDGAILASGSLASLSRISFVAEDLKPASPSSLDAFIVENGSLLSNTTDATVRVYSLGGGRIITSSYGNVSTLDLPAGAYIVVSGGKAAKIIVK